MINLRLISWRCHSTCALTRGNQRFPIIIRAQVSAISVPVFLHKLFLLFLGKFFPRADVGRVGNVRVWSVCRRCLGRCRRISRAVAYRRRRRGGRLLVGLLLGVLIRFQAEIKRGPAQKRPPDRVGCFSGDDAGLGKRRSPTTEDTDPSKRTANRSGVARRGPGVGRHSTAVSRARAAPTNCRITSSTWLSAGPLPERMCPVTSGISAARPCVTSIR